MLQALLLLIEPTTPAPAPEKTGEKAVMAIDKQLTLLESSAKTLVDWATTKGPSVLGALVIFMVAWVLSKRARRTLLAALLRANVDTLLAKFFANMARWAVLTFAVVSCLGTLGIETTSLAAVIGAMGLAIGLALQGNLGNLASGVLLLIFRPFKIGDAVIVAGQAGVIDGIDLFTTNLDTADHRRIIIPNSSIFGGIIENQSHHPQRSLTVPVTVASGIELDRGEAVLGAMAARIVASAPGALSTPAPSVTLVEIAPNTVWNVTVWFETARFGTARAAVLREVKRTVEAEKLAPAAGVQLVRHVP
jgi:small conductance mechanosensitive channel